MPCLASPAVTAPGRRHLDNRSGHMTPPNSRGTFSRAGLLVPVSRARVAELSRDPRAADGKDKMAATTTMALVRGRWGGGTRPGRLLAGLFSAPRGSSRGEGRDRGAAAKGARASRALSGPAGEGWRL